MKHLFKKSIYLIVILVGIELGLRFLGYKPYASSARGELPYLKPDQFKGWVYNPGNYQFIVNTWGDTMNFSINERGERFTKADTVQEGKENILLIGGSFTMGMGLNDAQTFAWKLQQKFPSVDIRNLGVGAYGTYQSLLVLEEQLRQGYKPKAVIYGFISNHRLRNVAQPDWLNVITVNEKASNIKVELPYVTLGANETLIRGEPLSLLQTPFSNHLATSFMLQRAINNIAGYTRVKNADKILELLLLEMQQLCEKQNIPFYVSIMACETPLMSKLTSFFRQNDMAYIDCNVPLNADNTFRDDGHPKEVINIEWANTIEKRLVQDDLLIKPLH